MGKILGIDLGTTNSAMAIMEGGQPKIIENDNDSVLSHSITKKIGFVTRHLLTAECTHSIVFEQEWYDRL